MITPFPKKTSNPMGICIFLVLMGKTDFHDLNRNI
jgi:hypothetical protein